MKSQQGPLVWSKLSLILVAAVSQKDFMVCRQDVSVDEWFAYMKRCHNNWWKLLILKVISMYNYFKGAANKKIQMHAKWIACIHSLFNWVKFSLILKSLCLLILLLQVECGLVLPHWLTCRWNPPLMVPLANLLLIF